jgi:aspartate aminotransferase-like enzyme
LHVAASRSPSGTLSSVLSMHMEYKKRIFTPGPTEVPSQVLQSLARPLVHHRTGFFREMHLSIANGLKYVFRTENPIVIWTSSGTGAMEAAMANVTLPGDKILTTPCGKFGERWCELASTYGLQVLRAEAEWGRVVTPGQVEDALKNDSGVSVVFTTLCETSTGVCQDVKEIARIAHKYGALVVVDAIAGLCSEELDTDAWGLDVVLGGSQKGFGTPPGLSFLSLSRDAIARIRTKGHPVYYFDLVKALDSLEKGDTPYTPAIALFVGLGEALKIIREMGIENTIERHRRNAQAVRSAVAALDLKLFAEVPSNATTAVIPPEGSASAIIDLMDKRYGIRIAGGQGKLAGHILRLGHLGFYNESDMYTMIAALEATLLDLKLNPSPGKGIKSLLESFHKDGPIDV